MWSYICAPVYVFQQVKHKKSVWFVFKYVSSYVFYTKMLLCLCETSAWVGGDEIVRNSEEKAAFKYVYNTNLQLGCLVRNVGGKKWRIWHSSSEPPLVSEVLPSLGHLSCRGPCHLVTPWIVLEKPLCTQTTLFTWCVLLELHHSIGRITKTPPCFLITHFSLFPNPISQSSQNWMGTFSFAADYWFYHNFTHHFDFFFMPKNSINSKSPWNCPWIALFAISPVLGTIHVWITNALQDNSHCIFQVYLRFFFPLKIEISIFFFFNRKQESSTFKASTLNHHARIFYCLICYPSISLSLK